MVLSLRYAVERVWGGRKVKGRVVSRNNVVRFIGMDGDGDYCTLRLLCLACDQWVQTVRGTVEASVAPEKLEFGLENSD